MMKHLFVLALAGASCAAAAQSSVTLFGVVDATIARGWGSIAGRTQLSRGGLTTPRLGFRGIEDLGGGMSAIFWLEGQVNTDDGTSTPTTVNNQAPAAVAPAGTQGLTFARRATVSIAGPWGELRAGRDYTPQYWSYLYGDAFGNVGVGTAVNHSLPLAGIIQTRASNGLMYFSPRFGGFALNVMHYLGENPSNVPNSDDGTGTGVRLSYEGGPFTAGAGYGRTDFATGDLIQRNAYAAWNFGIVRVMGDITREELGAVTSKGGAASVVVPVGFGEIRAAYSTFQTSAEGNPTARKLAAGYVHNLSKRTALYFTYAKVKNSGGMAHALNGGVTAPNASASGFDLGLRHSF